MKHAFLNKLVTNQYLVRFSHLLSEGLNCVSGLGGGAKRRRAENRAALERFSGEGFINGQGRGAVARLPFGKFTMDYNGCEVIACYNALRLLGTPFPLAEVAARFERRGIFLAGKWGTHVSAVPKFFTELGCRPETLYASSARGAEDYDAAFADAGAAVFSFWNSAEDLLKGVHTVALSHGRDGGLLICNLYSLDCGPNADYPSIAAFIRGAGILPILLITLRKRNT